VKENSFELPFAPHNAGAKDKINVEAEKFCDLFSANERPLHAIWIEKNGTSY
jgi:hypothetical protein